MRVEHGWIRVWLLSNLGTRQFLVQHLRWCEEVIVDHSESSMKKGDAPGGRSDGDFTWLTKPNVDGMCTSSWIGMQTMFQPSEQKPAGFNVPYLHGNFFYPKTTSPTLVTPAGLSSNWGQGGLRPALWHRFAFRCRPGFLEPHGWWVEIVGNLWIDVWVQSILSKLVQVGDRFLQVGFALGGWEEFCIEHCTVFWMVFHECPMITDQAFKEICSETLVSHAPVLRRWLLA